VQRRVQTPEIQPGLQLILSACPDGLTNLHGLCKGLHVQLQLNLLPCTHVDCENVAVCLLQHGSPVTQVVVPMLLGAQLAEHISCNFTCTSADKSCVLQLCDLYENDCIFDKFDCAISGNGQYVTTGSYNNFLKVTGRQGGPETIVEASRDPLRKRLQPQAKVQRPVSHSKPNKPCAHHRATQSAHLNAYERVQIKHSCNIFVYMCLCCHHGMHCWLLGNDVSVQVILMACLKWLSLLVQASSRFGLNRGASKRLTTPAPAEQDAGNTDFSEKLLHLAWHPEANLIAAAASNSLYMFCAK